jgi:hypothetical protein
MVPPDTQGPPRNGPDRAKAGNVLQQKLQVDTGDRGRGGGAANSTSGSSVVVGLVITMAASMPGTEP